MPFGLTNAPASSLLYLTAFWYRLFFSFYLLLPSNVSQGNYSPLQRFHYLIMLRFPILCYHVLYQLCLLMRTSCGHEDPTILSYVRRLIIFYIFPFDYESFFFFLYISIF